MSQPDLARTLRAARPVAPAELRERVRLIAAQASPPRRQLVTWRRALVFAVVVGAAIAAGVIATRPAHAQRYAAVRTPRAVRPATARDARCAAIRRPAPTSSAASTAAAPAPSAKRLQNYSASLDLRVPTSAAVSTDTQHAIAIANSLGGYLAFVNVDAGGKTGYAEIRLRIPKVHVQEAVRRLSALGRVVSENVRDPGSPGQRQRDRPPDRAAPDQLAALRTQFQTTLVQRQIASLTTPDRAPPARPRQTPCARASYATVALSSARRPPHPPARTTTARCTGSASRSAGSGSARSTRSRSACRCSCSPG